MTGGARVWLVAAAVATAVVPAQAQRAASLRALDPDRMLADLDANDFATRSRAQQSLVVSPEVTDGFLIERLRDVRTTPEQALRLTRIIRERFEQTPRGAIGIRFDTDQQFGVTTMIGPGGGPVIGDVDVRFPAGAQGLIQPGDEFVAVDGVPLTNLDPRGRTERLQAATFSRRPGEIMPVTIRRPGATPDDPAEIIEIDLPLGGAENLDGFQARRGKLSNGLQPAQSDIGWRGYMVRHGLVETFEPLRTTTDQIDPWEPDRNGATRVADHSRLVTSPLNVEADANRLPGNGGDPRINQAMLDLIVNRAPEGVVVRGQARPVDIRRAAPVRVENEELVAARRDEHLQRAILKQQARELRRLGMPDATPPTPSDPLEAANRMAARLADLRSQLAQVSRQAGQTGADLSAEARRAAEQRAGEIRDRIAELETELELALILAEEP